MFVLLLFLLFADLSPAQDSNIDKYQFISPLPGSKLIMPENNIIIRQGDIIDATTIKKVSIEVIGSISGVHSGDFFLSDDMRTLIFIPKIPYELGEKVSVSFAGGIKTFKNQTLAPIEFYFYISTGLSAEIKCRALLEFSDYSRKKLNFYSGHQYKNAKLKIAEGSPLQFPPITVTISNNPSNGYIFISPFTLSGPPGHMLILDNNGIPIFYRQTPYYRVTDFKLQPNGLISFHTIGGGHRYYLMDSSYNIIDSVYAGNGYMADDHDIQIVPNGHFLLMAYDAQTVRMDTIVVGGDSAAIVIGLIVQELDTSKNVVFQWRSWDHYQITDATEDIDLTQHTIDYVHGNTVELDNDGNLLISCRNMDEVTKIDRQTGETIWRWGGLKSRNNEYTFIGDPVTFSHQHDVRRLPNGNITLFDNGRLHQLQVSRSREYELDEEEKTATLIWSFSNDPQIYSPVMGSTQRQSNNNTVVGWGWNASSEIAVSEVDVEGNVRFELSLSDTFVNYRATKFHWKTNLFVTNPDSIFFESIPVGDSAIISVDLINNSAEPVDITGYYNVNEYYVVENPVPFTLPAFGTVSLNIKFKPSEDGYFKDYLHIRSDTETSRIAQVMILAGRTDTITGNGDVIIFLLEQNYPNPFNPGTTIRYSIPTQSNVRLRVYNSIGENIAKLVDVNQAAGSYEINWDAGNVASGIYFYSIEAMPTDGTEYFHSVKKMILLK